MFKIKKNYIRIPTISIETPICEPPGNSIPCVRREAILTSVVRTVHRGTKQGRVGACDDRGDWCSSPLQLTAGSSAGRRVGARGTRVTDRPQRGTHLCLSAHAFPVHTAPQVVAWPRVPLAITHTQNRQDAIPAVLAMNSV